MKEESIETAKQVEITENGDPDLLRKMREQQNARQKKYYARLRMRQMHSGEWDNSLEDGQWSS